MTSNEKLFESPLLRDVNYLASRLDPGWPDSAARAYVLSTAIGEDRVSRVRLLLADDRHSLDVAKALLDAGDADSAFGAASLAVFQPPDDAANLFYAAESLLVLNQVPMAAELMKLSAARASGRQAAQGRRSLLELGRRHDLSPEVIAAMRGILGAALQGDGSALDDEAEYDEADRETDLEQSGVVANGEVTTEEGT